MNEPLHAPVSGFHGSPDRLDGPRDLAALHRDAWSVMKRHAGFFVAFPLLAQLPFDVLSECVALAAGDDVLQSIKLADRVQRIVGLLWGTYVVMLLMHGLVIAGEGGTPTVREAMKRARGTYGRVVNTTFVVGILTTLSAFLLIVPAFFFATRWMFAVPAAALDGKDRAGARATSSELVMGRGTFRLFLYAFAMMVTYYVIALTPALVGGFLTAEVTGVPSAVLTALLSIPINLALTGLAVGAGLLYLELSGRELLHPVGLGLVDAQGRRAEAPASSGQLGLAVIGVLGGLLLLVFIPLMVISIWAIVDADSAGAALQGAPAWMLSLLGE
jgi:hypothetical protein